jgi:hypothetical protein
MSVEQDPAIRRLTWVTCQARSVQSVDPTECRGDDAFELVLKVERRPEKRFENGDALVFASVTPDGSTYATVFHDGVLAVIKRGGPCSESMLLGHAIAHELGHLLLDTPAHSRYGLMTGRWGPAELDRAASGSLLFSSAEAATMRVEVLRRNNESRLAFVANP